MVWIPLNIPIKITSRYILFILRPILTKHIDLLSGDDGDSMEAPGAHHLINQTPLSAAWLELQDLIVVVFVVVVVVCLSSCHYHSLVDVRSSQTVARSWELSRIDPLGRVLHQQLRGREVDIHPPARDEECLGPLLILKVAAPMTLSALL